MSTGIVGGGGVHAVVEMLGLAMMWWIIGYALPEIFGNRQIWCIGDL